MMKKLILLFCLLVLICPSIFSTRSSYSRAGPAQRWAEWGYGDLGVYTLAGFENNSWLTSSRFTESELLRQLEFLDNQHRAIGEAFGLGVDWDKYEELIRINYECAQDIVTGKIACPAQDSSSAMCLDTKLMENCTKERVDATGLEVNTISSYDEDSYGTLLLRVKTDYGIEESNLAVIDFSVFENGVELGEKTDELHVGDTISFNLKLAEGLEVPEAGETRQVRDGIIFEPAMNDIGVDWIATGALYGTPPIYLVEDEEFEKIFNALLNKTNNRYPCNYSTGHMGTLLNPQCELPIPVFKPEETEFPNSSSYDGPLGYKAFVVPLKGGKKMGAQVFCTADISHTQLIYGLGGYLPTGTHAEPEITYGNFIHGDGFDCEPNDYGIDCLVKKPANFRAEYNDVRIDFGISLYCFTFADKFYNGKGLMAEWISFTSSDVYFDKEFRVLLEGDESPTADFSCEPVEEEGELYLDCESLSFDPDGKIDRYCWQDICLPGGKRWQWQMKTVRLKLPKHGSYSVSLTVWDDDGYRNKTVKNIDTNPNLFEILTADHQNGMAQITTECEGSVELTIENKLTGQAEIESVEIPCGQTSEIGPIEKTGAYNAIGTNNGQTREAIFTVV